jgi:hypothetical protein
MATRVIRDALASRPLHTPTVISLSSFVVIAELFAAALTVAPRRVVPMLKAALRATARVATPLRFTAGPPRPSGEGA